MTAIFPGWMVAAQRVEDGRVVVLLWRTAMAASNGYCLIRHQGGVKGGWRYRNLWAANYAFERWDGLTPPMAGEWADFEARA